MTIVDHQTDRLIHLVEDLLVLSKIETGKLGFDPHPIDPPDFLAHVVRELGGSAPRVRIEAPEPIPTFVADPNRLGQVLMNLLQNAFRFSGPTARSGSSSRSSAPASTRGYGST